jgi:hypothetical protein
MRLFYFAFSLLLVISCTKKSAIIPTALSGIWVETTLRLDTLDFEINNLIDNNSGYTVANFSTNSYTDTVLNPNYPVNHSSIYNYYLNTDSSKIFMRCMLSSFSGFNQYNFIMQGSQQRFSIDKFYNRRALPATIEFLRIR